MMTITILFIIILPLLILAFATYLDIKAKQINAPFLDLDSPQEGRVKVSGKVICEAPLNLYLSNKKALCSRVTIGTLGSASSYDGNTGRNLITDFNYCEEASIVYHGTPIKIDFSLDMDFSVLGGCFSRAIGGFRSDKTEKILKEYSIDVSSKEKFFRCSESHIPLDIEITVQGLYDQVNQRIYGTKKDKIIISAEV